MGSGNCTGCKCTKDGDETEIKFTEKNQQVNISQDAISAISGEEGREGVERNKINSMVKGNMPSELFKEDLIKFDYETNSKRANSTLTPMDKNALNKNELGIQINNENKNPNESNTNDKIKQTSSLDGIILQDDLNSKDKQDQLKNFLKEMQKSQSMNNNNKHTNKNSNNPNEKCDSINFGMFNQAELTFEQQKLLFETQKNLNQFYPPQALELKTLNSKLKKIPLTSIVPEYKLLTNLSEDELIFNGDLKKLINYEINAHKPQLYSSRFCTLTKTAFRYYKSKEQYLTMNKPICTVPFNQITKFSFIKTKKTSKKIDHILICNKLGIIKDQRQIAHSKQFEVYEQNAYENNESLLIFTSEIEDFLLKWYLLINFFLSEISKKNE